MHGWAAASPLNFDGLSYNTGGVYDIELRFSAFDGESGEAFMRINTLDQGFETNGDRYTMELWPAGMTFSGDLNQVQVFYGLATPLVTHVIDYRDIVVTGCHPPVDIRPGSYPNSFNLRGGGVIPVAILTTSNLDAMDVDPTSVIFGDLVGGVVVGPSPLRWVYEDVDFDGDVDLTLKFDKKEVAQVLSADDTVAYLSADVAGTTIIWADTVNITQN